ncbi:hypothetical protein, partial [Alkalihalobacillus trypoxylicola]
MDVKSDEAGKRSRGKISIHPKKLESQEKGQKKEFYSPEKAAEPRKGSKKRALFTRKSWRA